jgi:hypothetical protein
VPKHVQRLTLGGIERLIDEHFKDNHSPKAHQATSLFVQRLKVSSHLGLTYLRVKLYQSDWTLLHPCSHFTSTSNY